MSFATVALTKPCATSAATASALACLGSPKPAPPASDRAHARAGLDLDTTLRMHRLAVHGVDSQRSVPAAEEAPGRELGAVAHAERHQRLAGIIAQGHLLPEAAAPAPGAA